MELLIGQRFPIVRGSRSRIWHPEGGISVCFLDQQTVNHTCKTMVALIQPLIEGMIAAQADNIPDNAGTDEISHIGASTVTPRSRSSSTSAITL